MSKVITIGRQFGSGGRELGKRLAEKLGFAYYDNEIVSEIAKKTELAEEYVQRIVEKAPSIVYPITIGHSFYPVSSPQLVQSSAIYQEQHNIIRKMSEKGDCVIVGRCADYILCDKQPLRLFVYATEEFKMARCRAKAPVGEEEMSDRELRRHIRDIDRDRARYYEFITGQKWGDPLNYDICVNTSNVPIKQIVSSIARMVNDGE